MLFIWASLWEYYNFYYFNQKNLRIILLSILLALFIYFFFFFLFIILVSFRIDTSFYFEIKFNCIFLFKHVCLLYGFTPLPHTQLYSTHPHSSYFTYWNIKYTKSYSFNKKDIKDIYIDETYIYSPCIFRFKKKKIC